jgi:hypothetical protein
VASFIPRIPNFLKNQKTANQCLPRKDKMMQLNAALLFDASETALLEGPPVAKPVLLTKPVKAASSTMDFRQAACNLPQEARFSVEVVRARSWESCDNLVVGMHVGRRTRLVVDALPQDDVPGASLSEKRRYLTDAYKNACRSLNVVFEENTQTLNGWRIRRPESEGECPHFVPVHHGVDRLRAWVGVETGTVARRVLGQEEKLHDRCSNLLAPFYRP